MITYERTADLNLVRKIIRLPQIYRAVSDDLCAPAEQYEPANHPAIWYVLARHNSLLAGMFVFHPQNSICWEVHTCLLPWTWMEPGCTLAAARGIIGWIWEHTPCRRIVTNVPAYNRLALKFAKRAGLEEYGRNPKSYLKHGVLQDQILLGISKP